MAKLFIFLDESGDLGKRGSKYFSIAVVYTENPKELERCIKRIRTRKLKKKLKELSEIKANNSNAAVRRRVLKDLTKTSCHIDVITVNKEKIYSYLFEKKEKLYNYIAGILLDEIQIHQEDVEIIVDKKYTNTILKDEFDNYIKSKIFASRPKVNANIIHLMSHEKHGLQAADFVAWSVNRKFSFDDDSYFKIIEKKISKVINLWENKNNQTDPTGA